MATSNPITAPLDPATPAYMKAHINDSRGPELLAVLIVLLSLSYFFFAVRCYIRIRIIKAFAIDDWFTFLTLIFFTSYAGVGIWSVFRGVGRHTWALSLDQTEKLLFTTFLNGVFYNISTLLVRVSVAVFLLRITVHKTHRWFIYAIVALNTIFSVFYFFFSVFQCLPVSYLWEQLNPLTAGKGKCVDVVVSKNLVFVSAAISIFTDFSLGLLPTLILHDLQMNIRKKVAVGVLLSLGMVISIAAVARIVSVVKVNKSQDVLWDTTDIAIWSTVEPGLGIIILCLSTFRPLFQSFFDTASTIAHRTRAIKLGSSTHYGASSESKVSSGRIGAKGSQSTGRLTTLLSSGSRQKDGSEYALRNLDGGANNSTDLARDVEIGIGTPNSVSSFNRVMFTSWRDDEEWAVTKTMGVKANSETAS